MPAGIRYTISATSIAVPSPRSAATQAGFRLTPNKYSSMKIGRAATSADSPRFSTTGL